MVVTSSHGFGVSAFGFWPFADAYRFVRLNFSPLLLDQRSQPRADRQELLYPLSSVVPHFLQTRTFRSPRSSWPMRTGPQVEHTNCTLEIAIRLSCSAMPPLMLRWGFGRTCFFTIITCSTRILASFGNTRSTRPSLPLSRPVITLTVSLRRISTRLFSVLTIRIKSKFQGFKFQSFKIKFRPARLPIFQGTLKP